MTTALCEIEGAAVVLVGHFNPALVHPEWLARRELIRDSEVAAANVSLIRPELGIFSVGPFHFQTEPERFTIQIVDLGQLGPLQDLVSSIFGLLSQTPISQFGLSRHMHFRMSTAESRQQVGKAIAPQAPWEGLVEESVMRSVVIWGNWSDFGTKQVQVNVEPSLRVLQGVYVAVTAHFEVNGAETDSAIAAMSGAWDRSFAKARTVGESIAALGQK